MAKSFICRGCQQISPNPHYHTGRVYCSNACQAAFKVKQTIERWLNDPSNPDTSMNVTGILNISIRKYLLDKASNACSMCGWNQINPFTKTCPLEIDHKDGNSDNNHPDNLQVLCPNCHALTSTYKGANANKRAKSRRSKYFQKYYDKKSDR